MEGTDELRRICEAGGVVRENYYSTTYRTEFGLNGGEIKKWDIQHIRVPFSPIKEEKFKARFGLTDDELADFYSRFVKEIKQHLVVTEELKSLGDESRIDSSTAYCESRKISKDDSDGHYDIYIVMRQADPLIGSHFISNSGSMKSGILTIGARLLQSVKNYNDRGYSIGAIDLDSMLVETVDGKSFIKDAFFLAATSKRGNLSSYTVDLHTHMPEEIVAGNAAPSYNGDIYTVCSLLWTMLDGQHYTMPPDLTSPPRYSSPELYDLLRAAMSDGAGAYKELSRAIRQELSAINNGTETDTVIPFTVPPYIAAYNEIEAREKEKRLAEEESKTEAEEEPVDDKKSKIKKAISISVLLIAVLAAAFIFVVKPMIFPAPVIEEPVATPTPTPTPTPDPNAGKPDTTSAEEGLYTYEGIVVDAYGVPTSRFYLNNDGDIECEPGKIPARYSELELTDAVLKLDDEVLAGDSLSTDRVDVNLNTLLESDIRTGRLLMPADWNMTQHLRKVTAISIIPDADSLKTFNRYAGLEQPPEEGSVKLLVSNDDLESLKSGEQDLDEFYLSSLCGILNITLPEEDAVKLKETIDPESFQISILLDDSDWYEEYQYCDDNTYAKLLLIEREPECEKILSRTSDANGEEITLYYDEDGNTYTEDEWNVQEDLKKKIEDAKTELDAYKEIEGTVIMVPFFGVEEYVYTERISFSVNPMSVGLKKTTYGSAVSSSFMINVKIEPANATCQEIKASIDKKKGLNFPYSYNADYITGTHNTYESLTDMTLDFTKSTDGNLILAMDGSEFGEYEVTFASADHRAKSVLQISLVDSGETASDVNENAPASTSVPTSTPNTTGGGAGGGGGSIGGGGGSTSGGGNYGSGGNSSVTPTVPTPVPEQSVTPPSLTEAPMPEQPEIEEFTVTPAALTLAVGEMFDLKPSMSCTWSCDNPAVATIGGAQGRTVTALSAGSCTITARSSDGQMFYITVSVSE